MAGHKRYTKRTPSAEITAPETLTPSALIGGGSIVHAAIKRGPGQPPKFNTPDDLRRAFVEYIAFVESSPVCSERATGSGDIVTIKARRPVTLQGFATFAGISTRCFRHTEAREGFEEVCAWVRTIIEADQMEGALAGFYNPMIAARALGLRDTADITSNGKEITGQAQAIGAIHVAYKGTEFQLTAQDIGDKNVEDNERGND